MASYGVRVQEGYVATTADEAFQVASKLSGKRRLSLGRLSSQFELVSCSQIFLLLWDVQYFVLFLVAAADLILKAQILAGGRGKGHFDTGFKGGVHVLHRYGFTINRLCVYM